MKNSNSKQKFTRMAFAVAMGSGLLAAASFASADPGFYVGGEYGMGRINGGDFEDDTSVLKAFVGGKFNNYIGVEGAAIDFGEAEDNGFKSELTGASLAVVGFMPFTDSFEVFIKAGSLWWENDLEVLGFESSQDGTEFFYGAGLNFYFNKTIALRLELERYEVELSADEVGIDIDGTTDVDVASVGIVFNF